MTTHPRTLPASDLAHVADWYKSSYSSGTGNNCVELADLTRTAYRGIAVRDSKDPEGPALLVTAESWISFLAAIKQPPRGVTA
jgi:hypothetical protein